MTCFLLRKLEAEEQVEPEISRSKEITRERNEAENENHTEHHLSESLFCAENNLKMDETSQRETPGETASMRAAPSPQISRHQERKRDCHKNLVPGESPSSRKWIPWNHTLPKLTRREGGRRLVSISPQRPDPGFSAPHLPTPGPREVKALRALAHFSPRQGAQGH